MSTIRIPIAELRDRLEEFCAAIRRGEDVVLTDEGGMEADVRARRRISVRDTPAFGMWKHHTESVEDMMARLRAPRELP